MPYKKWRYCKYTVLLYVILSKYTVNILYFAQQYETYCSQKKAYCILVYLHKDFILYFCTHTEKQYTHTKHSIKTLCKHTKIQYAFFCEQYISYYCAKYSIFTVYFNNIAYSNTVYLQYFHFYREVIWNYFTC